MGEDEGTGRKGLDAWAARGAHEPGDAEEGLVYHYCPFPRFVGIVRSHEIRFADLSSMDDPNEKRFLWDIYFKTLSDRLGTEPFFPGFKKRQDPDGTIQMSASFTDDGADPHMWHGYARGGTGVAMGFDRRMLEDWADLILWDNTLEKEKFDSFPDEGGKRIELENCVRIADYGHVWYPEDDAEAEERVRADIECDIAEFAAANDGSLVNLTPGFVHTLEMAPFTKKKDYSPEKEYRVVISLKPEITGLGRLPASCMYGSDHKVKEVEWGSNSFSPLFPQLFIPFPEGMLRKVRLGPECDNDAVCVEDYLKRLGYDDTEVEKAGLGELEGDDAGEGVR